MKTNSHRVALSGAVPSWHMGAKAFLVEPWLILGSFLLWLAVLPFAGVVWSGTMLSRRVQAGSC